MNVHPEHLNLDITHIQPYETYENVKQPQA